MTNDFKLTIKNLTAVEETVADDNNATEIESEVVAED